MKSKLRNNFKYFLELSKLKIMIPVSLTGFTGYFIFDPHITLKLMLISIGILLLAISASVLNQIQEVDLDSKMKRTQNRPLPTRKITIQQAVILFFFTLLAGTVIIYTVSNFTATLIGLIAILWYSGIYTYAKRITAFAVVPGALTGALPPLIGWVAAGGGAWDKSIIFIEFLFFIGQVPHFWLLISRYGEEYENAGIPSITALLSRSQINRLTFMWVVVSIIAALFLCNFGIIQTRLIVGILMIVSIIMIWQFFNLLKTPANKINYKRFSFLLDSYFLLILLLLISDKIIA
ncbi:MAG: protoheme IX farnesyltransferase [Bacteroidetes bacterium]|nr:MAG: protoheme IX farnesyltransferase [Bacteroidota bacterium]